MKKTTNQPKRKKKNQPTTKPQNPESCRAEKNHLLTRLDPA